MKSSSTTRSTTTSDVIVVSAVLVTTASIVVPPQPRVVSPTAEREVKKVDMADVAATSNTTTTTPTSSGRKNATRTPSDRCNARSGNATNAISSRRQRKQLKHNPSLHQDGVKTGSYLYALSFLGALYLIAIFSLACWECLISPSRVRRLNDASLAVATGPTPFEYHQLTTTSTGSFNAEFATWQTRASGDHLDRDFVPSDDPINNDDVIDTRDSPVSLHKGGVLQPPRPQYVSNDAAKHITAEQGTLSDGTLFYRCGDWSPNHGGDDDHSENGGSVNSNDSTTEAKEGKRKRQRPPPRTQSRDVVFLSAKTFFDKPQYNDALLLLDDKTGERAFMELCHRAQQVSSGIVDSIVALDIDESAPPARIHAALRDLMELDRLAMVPVAAIVTPGRSAATIVDWIVYSEPDELQSLKTQVARNWIVVDADMSDFEFNPDYGYRHARRHVIAEGVNDEVGLERRHEIASDNECRASSDDDENDTRVMPASSSLPLSSPSPTANTFSIHVSPLYSFLQEYGGWSMLYVHGVHDEFGQRNARILRELAKGVVAEIGDVGANVLVEAPIEFAEAMLTYLEQERSFQGRTFRKEL